jgi:hypothetical protein
VPWLPRAASLDRVPSRTPSGDDTVTIDTAVPGSDSLGLYTAPGEKLTLAVADAPR